MRGVSSEGGGRKVPALKAGFTTEAQRTQRTAADKPPMLRGTDFSREDAKGGGGRRGVQRKGAGSACRVGFHRRGAEGQEAQRRGVNRGRGVVRSGPGDCVAWKAIAQRKGAKTPGRKGREREGGVVRGGRGESAGLEGGLTAKTQRARGPEKED